MIKLAQIKKFASFYKLAVFLATAGEQDVANALRELSTTLDYGTQVIPIFDAWQTAIDVKAPNEMRQSAIAELESYYTQYASENPDLHYHLNLILEDAYDSVNNNGDEGLGYSGRGENVAGPVDVDLGLEHGKQEGSGQVGESREQMNARKKLEAERHRFIYKSLQKIFSKEKLDEITSLVSANIPYQEIGITDEQFRAIKHILSKNTDAKQRNRKAREIKRLMTLGLSKEEAEAKYRERLSQSDVSQIQLDFVRQRLEDKGIQASDEQISDEIKKQLVKGSEFDRKKVIKLTDSQKKNIQRYRIKYQKELEKKYPTELAAKLAKEKFKELVQKVKPMNEEETNWEIKDFNLKLYGKENTDPRPQSVSETSVLEGIDLTPSTPAEKKPEPIKTKPTRGRIVGPRSTKVEERSNTPKQESESDELKRLMQEQQSDVDTFSDSREKEDKTDYEEALGY